MPTCFLTGATGFVGGHVARALLAQGWTVRALVRGDPARLRDLGNAGVTPVPGDLSPASDFSGALADCDAIVHVAGLVKARTLDDYREGNARAVERLVQSAKRVCPKAMFVLVSSQAAAGPARDARPVTESDAPHPVSWYGISKREGEEAVARGWTGPWIAVRPAVVYGPGDRGLLLMFRSAAKGWLPVPAGRSRIQVIFAEEAGLAIARAASRPDLSGRTPFLCDPEPVKIRDFCAVIAGLAPKKARLVPVPDVALRAAGAMETMRETLMRRSRPFNADKAREILAGDWVCDSLPLRRDLDLPPPVALAEGLARTWRWYGEKGWLDL
jgi:nucleoside-diphosphate-sugar epimerase